MSQPTHITVCGHYGEGNKLADGQTVKTQNMVAALTNIYGVSAVSICDTYRWKRKPLKLLTSCVKAMKQSSDVIILPADNGINIFLPLFAILNAVYGTRLHYSVIGGWLYERLRKNPILIRCLNSFTTIQVETEQMKTELQKINIKNVYVVYNFKNIDSITEAECQKQTYTEPLPLCTFSRVMAEKGIEDAIEVVTKLNSMGNMPRYKLDIYGQINIDYEEKFEEIMERAPAEITYKGTIDSSESVAVLKSYYLLLFPTHYATEGLPGSIIDSYAAGLPVISYKWNSFADIIKEGVTGFGIDIGNKQQFYEMLIKLNDQQLVLPLKSNCLEAFLPYSYDKVCVALRQCLEKET